MRITGGRYRSRIISCPPGVIRPVQDRMRESMFSILGDLRGLTFLDLFAGSGIVAIEALSRGAVMAHLVERDAAKKKILRRNLDIVGEGAESQNFKIFIRPVERYLKMPIERFDIVNCDPPFAMKNKLGILKLVEQAAQPATGGRFMIHYPIQEDLPKIIGSLKSYDERRYGQSMLRFYTRED